MTIDPKSNLGKKLNAAFAEVESYVPDGPVVVGFSPGTPEAVIQQHMEDLKAWSLPIKMKDKVYTVATLMTTSHNQGADDTAFCIIPMEAYCAGSFPPCFKSQAEAELWLSRNKDKFYSETKIVMLERQ